MEVHYSGSISYDIESILPQVDNFMTDKEIKEVLYSDFCSYEDFEYGILCSEMEQILAEVRARIGEQMKIEEF